MEIAFYIASGLLLISIFLNINLLRKNELGEDYITELEESNIEYNLFFERMKTFLSQSNTHLKNLDRIGSFESDDETGFIFKEMKKIIEQLNQRF